MSCHQVMTALSACQKRFPKEHDVSELHRNHTLIQSLGSRTQMPAGTDLVIPPGPLPTAMLCQLSSAASPPFGPFALQVFCRHLHESAGWCIFASLCPREGEQGSRDGRPRGPHGARSARDLLSCCTCAVAALEDCLGTSNIRTRSPDIPYRCQARVLGGDVTPAPSPGTHSRSADAGSSEACITPRTGAPGPAGRLPRRAASRR